MLIRIRSWEEFRKLIIENDPKSMAYNIEQGIPARNLTGLRLILPVEGKQYVFVDTASGDRLRKTGIPLNRDKLGNLYIRDEDVKGFIKSETGRNNLMLHSYWTI